MSEIFIHLQCPVLIIHFNITLHLRLEYEYDISFQFTVKVPEDKGSICPLILPIYNLPLPIILRFKFSPPYKPHISLSWLLIPCVKKKMPGHLSLYMFAFSYKFSMFFLSSLIVSLKDCLF